MRFLLLATSIFLTTPDISHAQRNITKIQCTHVGGVYVDYKTGKTRITPGQAGEFRDLIFDQIQQNSNRARLIGNSGLTDALVIRGGDATNFIESPASGYLNVTAVYRIERLNLDEVVWFYHVGYLQTPIGAVPTEYWGVCREFFK